MRRILIINQWQCEASRTDLLIRSRRLPANPVCLPRGYSWQPLSWGAGGDIVTCWLCPRSVVASTHHSPSPPPRFQPCPLPFLGHCRRALSWFPYFQFWFTQVPYPHCSINNFLPWKLYHCALLPKTFFLASMIFRKPPISLTWPWRVCMNGGYLPLTPRIWVPAPSPHQPLFYWGVVTFIWWLIATSPQL